MSLIKLGSNYRVFYESKNLVSGVDNIFAIIKRPDGLKVGPIELSEETITEMLGTYSVEYLIPVNSPLGEWTGVVYSMDEGIKSGFRFSVVELSGGGSEINCEDQVELLVDTAVVDILVEELSEVELLVESEEVDLFVESEEVDLLISEENINLSIEENEVVLIVDCED